MGKLPINGNPHLWGPEVLEIVNTSQPALASSSSMICATSKFLQVYHVGNAMA